MLGNKKGKQLNKYVPDYVLYDLETTGISANYDEVIEISAVKVRGGKIIDEFSTLVNPGRTIPYGASAVNHIYDEMVADFHMIRSVVAYRNAYHLRPPKLGYDEIFCYVTNNQSGILDIIINEDHMLAKMLASVQYHPKVHRMMAVIKENIKQRIINTQKRWDKIVDFGGCFIDEWNDAKNIATVQAMWCLEDDFVVSLNEYISSVLDNRDRAELGLIALEFHRDDFINWWFEPGEQTR